MSQGAAVFWVGIVGLLGSLIVYGLNERSKRAYDAFVRRELKCWEHIRSIPGFYRSTLDHCLQRQFIQQASSCWMYCPDAVVRQVCSFMDAVRADGPASDERKAAAEAKLTVAIRKDSCGKRGRSALTESNFRHLEPVDWPWAEQPGVPRPTAARRCKVTPS